MKIKGDFAVWDSWLTWKSTRYEGFWYKPFGLKQWLQWFKGEIPMYILWFPFKTKHIKGL